MDEGRNAATAPGEMIPEEDLQKYARYLARRHQWILSYRPDYAMEDLEMLAAMAIIQAVRAEGTETRKWVYIAPLYLKHQLKMELHLYQEPARFEMAATANKLRLDAPIKDGSDMTAAEILPDTDAVQPEQAAIADGIARAVWDALRALDDDLTRDVIIMHYMYGVTNQDIADTLQIRKRDVHNMLARGKLQLRYNHRLRAVVEAGIDELTPFYHGSGYGAWSHTGLSAPERLTIWRDEIRRKFKYYEHKNAQEVDNMQLQ